jgi:uncharacterized repeat protein (TIGR03837 family)
LTVSLFCYDNPALPVLLGAWAEGGDLVTCRVADGLPRRQVETWLGRSFPVGTRLFRGSLQLDAMPFVPQSDYDHVLVTSDLNFVRGEDSFVRAQWAERPFVWQAYPQADGTHLAKVEAFLARYLRTLPDASRTPFGALHTTTADFHLAWNGRGDVAATWPAFRAVLPALAFHGHGWAVEISKQGNLAENLVRFCRERL